MSKQKDDQLKTAIIRNTVTIVTLLLVILGAVKTEQICYKIAQTGASLMVLNDNARFYNEQKRKTDSMTDAFNEEKKERNEKFYQSEDPLVRSYSNLPSLPKLIIWFTSLLLMLLTPFIAAIIVVREINTEIYFWKRKKRIRERRARKAEEEQLYKYQQSREMAEQRAYLRRVK